MSGMTTPRVAADVLELAPKDYEVDGDRSALLLRRLPPGLPPEARNALWGRTVNHFRQQQMWEGRQAFVDEEGTRARLWETAQKFLQAATVEAFGRPGTYVTRDQVMQRANMVDTEHFITIARYLEERGWIAEADFDYGVFVVTGSSITEATR